MNNHLNTKDHGFTLLEVVLVILIIGVIAITVTPTRLQVPMRMQYEATRVLNDIRYTQALSMASGQRYRWVRTSSTSYQITDEAGTAIMLPNGATTLTLASGISFGAFSNLPNTLVAFDSFGAPYTDSAYPGTALAATAIIPITNGTQTSNITIVQTTGYGDVS